MNILNRILGGYGGAYNLVFIFIFLILTVLFFNSHSKKRYHHAFVYFLFIIPIAIKTPNIYTIYEKSSFHIPVNEGIKFYTFYLLLFLYHIRKDPYFLVIIKVLQKNKLIAIGTLIALSFGISQQLALPVNYGFLISYTKIIEPFLFTAIVAFIVFKYHDEIEKLMLWIILSIFYSTLFSVISGLALNIDYSGVLRFGGGSIGSATIAGAIYVTWAIVSLGFFYISKTKKLKFLFLILFIILSFTALITHTRGPLGYYFIGLFLLIQIYPKYTRRRIHRTILILAPVLIMTLWSPISEEISKRNFNITKIDKDGPVMERVRRNKLAFQMLTKSPLLGNGFANPKEGERHNQEYEVYFYVYNTPLAWAFYGGTFSGIGFLLISLIIYKLSHFRKKNLPLNRTISSIFGIILIYWFIDYFTTANNFLFGFPFSSVVYFYIIIGVIFGNYVHTVIYDKLIRLNNVKNQ